VLQAGWSRFHFPFGSLRFFIDLILSGRTVALAFSQPPTKISTSKGGRCTGLTTFTPSCDHCPESWSLNLLELWGHVQTWILIAVLLYGVSN